MDAAHRAYIEEHGYTVQKEGDFWYVYSRPDEHSPWENGGIGHDREWKAIAAAMGHASQDARLAKVGALLNEDNEVVVQLADGCSLRSGTADGDFTSGEWVRLCDPHGDEILYWHNDEWADDPVLVMGAILNAAAGYRDIR